MSWIKIVKGDMMSIAASIDIKYIIGQYGNIKVINKLLQYGWSLNDNGVASYLPFGDEDDFNWRSENISFDNLMAILQKKEQSGELIGVVLTWKDSGIGGQFLFWNDGHISINLTLKRKMIETSTTKITDVNWYFTKLLPIFNEVELLVESLAYEEHA